METRARYALIGLFMLAVILASFAFVYWLENKGGFGQRDIYRVRFEGSVSGLGRRLGGAVQRHPRRRGDRVLARADQPQDVMATIAVERGTPVRGDTEVSLESQGLTGGAAIALSGGTSDLRLPARKTARRQCSPAPDPGRGLDPGRARRLSTNEFKCPRRNPNRCNSAIKNIDTFAGALARNSDKVDGIWWDRNALPAPRRQPNMAGLRSRRRNRFSRKAR